MGSETSLLTRLSGRIRSAPATPAFNKHAAELKGTLIATGLTKSYKGRQVVNGVSLGVRAGEAVGLLGPNGAGKTTCFYMVTGLVPVDKGKIEIDGKALEGSAYNSLGVLYYKVPGWPIGFGDKKKAAELLQKALALNPQGIDPNFFYAEYLVETKHPDQAVTYLERALQAPPRPGRQIADTGRREEARTLLARIKPN